MASGLQLTWGTGSLGYELLARGMFVALCEAQASGHDMQTGMLCLLSFAAGRHWQAQRLWVPGVLTQVMGPGPQLLIEGALSFTCCCW
jgi:hypothetical protein